MPPPLHFEILRRSPSSRARVGRVSTLHGAFDTPAFMPVGTQGTIKGVLPDHVAATGAQIILANTYHLMLRPGEDVVAQLGDLHQFMSWPGPILTDSGGFQVFSLSDLNKIDDTGVTFKSNIDGSIHHLTPTKSIEVQNKLGADIIMAFDECPPANAEPIYHEQAVARTLRTERAALILAGRNLALWTKYPGLDSVTADFRYLRLRRCAEDEPTGYNPDALDHWAERAKNWTAEGSDVFLYFINGAKIRAPAAAQALLARLK